jgi:hypothetical protein
MSIPGTPIRMDMSVLRYSGEIGQALRIVKGRPFIGTALCYLTTESVYFNFTCRLRSEYGIYTRIPDMHRTAMIVMTLSVR